MKVLLPHRPWSRALLAAIGGALLYAASLPPFDWVVGWFALVPLLTLIRDCPPRRALGFGLLYGVTCAWTVGWWFPQAAARYFDLAFPTGLLAAFAYATLVWGVSFSLFAWLAVHVRRAASDSAARYLLPAAWVTAELVRGRILGQPWGLLGYSQHAHVGLIQLAALTGVYGLSFLVALGNTVIADLIEAWRGGQPRVSFVRIFAIPVVLIAVIWSTGLIVATHGPEGGFSARRVVIVQTNVPPALQWTRSYTERQIGAHLRASEAIDATLRPALVVWPENAVPRYLEREPGLAGQLAALAIRKRADILFGAPHFADGQVYNSTRLITSDGHDGGYYHKRQLVPFAEEKPFRALAGATSDSDPTEFAAGRERGLLKSFVLLGVSICHEALFPDLIGDTVRNGAELLVNVSNDGWLDGGQGTASGQHFAMATLRAVETRRYLVRAATSGVSGIVDPYGRVVASLGAAREGAVTASVPGRSGLTFYVRFGDVFGLACVAAACASLARMRAARSLARQPVTRSAV